ATTLCAVVLAVTPAAASASKRCGRTWIDTRQVKAKVLVVKGSALCHNARKLIKTAFTAEDTRAWDGYGSWGVYWIVKRYHCSIGLGASETFCRRHGRQIDGSTRTDDGWRFCDGRRRNQSV